MSENEESFESALKTLEEAVESLESGELPLEEALKCFERGVESACRCRQALRDVETRVDLLLKSADGELTVEEFEQD